MRLTGTFGLQHLAQVPGDRLALAILVRRQQKLVGLLQLALEVGHDALLVGVDHVVRLEAVLDVDAMRPHGLSLIASGTSEARSGRSRM